MLKSQRIAVLPLDSYDLDSELEIIDVHDPGDEYDSFNFGSWSSHVLANGTGTARDTDFRPYHGQLALTSLGRRLPAIMSLVAEHFRTERLQWIRIFRLGDGLLAPHIDFLEFSKAGTRLQVPLRTSDQSLNSENDIVYHLRRGEVWRVCTTVPHSARSTATARPRLSLCLDFAGADQDIEIRNDIPASQDIETVSLPPLTGSELEELLATAARMTAGSMRTEFRRFASVHFERHADAAAAFDWFTTAAQRTCDDTLVRKAMAFRAYCIEKRGYKEVFDW